MQTESIKKILELNYSEKKEYTEEELNNIEFLKIDRFDIDGSILKVDYNELLLFFNLKSLTINECILNYDFFEIICKLKNLETLTLYNCEIVDDVTDVVNNLKIKNLNLENVNFNFEWFKDLYFNSLVLYNMEIKNNFIVNAKVLDIRKSVIENFEFITNNIIPKLIISERQYTNVFDNYKGHLIIMEDNGQFILKEVDNG